MDYLEVYSCDYLLYIINFFISDLLTHIVLPKLKNEIYADNEAYYISVFLCHVNCIA